MLVSQLLQPAFERFLTLEILSGRIEAPDFETNADDYFSADWRWQQWGSLDPVKDADSDISLLNAGLVSRAQLIAQRGGDIETVDAERDADPDKDLHKQQPKTQPPPPQEAAANG